MCAKSMVNSWNSTQSVVKAPKISVVNSQMLKRAGQSLDLAVVTAVTMESMGVTLPWCTYVNIQLFQYSTHTLLAGSTLVPATLPETLPFLDHTEWKKLNELRFLLGMWLQSKNTLLLGAYFLFGEILVHLLTMGGCC